MSDKSEIDSLKEQIKESEKILSESLENLEKNPDDYSAKLLVLSTENYLADLLRKLDEISAGLNKNKLN